MLPPSSAAKPPGAAAAADSSCWQFAWEAQSHASILRLLLFKANTKPSALCRDLKLSFHPQKALLTVSFWESEGQIETSVSVPVPRVLVDPESPLNSRVFDDHIEVKLVLLLPVDHPLVSNFDSILNVDDNSDKLLPLSVDSDLKKLSCMEEVHFYCRNCSSKLTKGLRCFKEMPSVNWREVADNWFGNCCCSFGGVSEKLVAEYAKSYTCVPGVCLLNSTSVALCTNDILGWKFHDMQSRQNIEPDVNPQSRYSSDTVSPNEVCKKVPADCCRNHSGGLLDIQSTKEIVFREDKPSADEENETLKNVVDSDSLSSTFAALQIEENKGLMNEETQNCHINCCTSNISETSSKVQMNEENVELLENQKLFLDGYLGNGFMVRSSELSKDFCWFNYLCPHCSCLLGAYPCFDDNVPLDGGIRLFKCYISTCVSSTGSSDAFASYSLERMFASQLLENAEDELSFRTIVRDIETKLPLLQIVILNPNSWECAGSLRSAEPVDKLVLHPVSRVLFSASGHGIDSMTLDEWMRKNQADEIYMFSSQISELTQVLELANCLTPPSCRSLQGLLLSSLRR
ncbi:uncharacterized protein LOC131004162 [Salvia miltiorrhiza]|uniref:uncharacterized protein LOC131004162 n=1 Tax=Salvia miltiorrhiza TaxID=226208 RepID=UPI0025ABE572|nr:uncharacterized protein LOC131004162 [Salvia miltiorrhiza]XP_057786769.1 uncharacterized protein LOC131004162 [Salvia miltiorrhiza]XP_057786770.1 uncharacterized protein LOC131004162 [Salvia miltiorrhiza]XP_057786771.1 uncharacterized protein LOC131004162 [Salvia miltiorrhiza]